MVLILAALLMLSAFFSGSETALFSLSRVAIARLESRGAHTLGKLMARPFRALTSLLVGNMLVNVAASSVAAAVALRLLGEQGMAVSFVVMTGLILLFGEILPKTVALSKAEALAPRVAPAVDLAARVFLPLRWVLQALSEGVVGLAKRWAGGPRTPVTHAEIEEAIELGHSGGALHGLERELLGNILEFGRTSVEEVMVPRVRVAAIEKSESVGRARQLMKTKRTPTLVVYEATPDNPVGVARACDLLEQPAHGEVGRLASTGPLVPQSRELSQALPQLAGSGPGVALVLDEFGAIAGLVVLEDVLEELVGTLPSGSDDWEWYRPEPDGSLVVSAMMRLEDLNRVLGTSLESEEYHTVGGVLLEATGRIPTQGEVVEKNGVRFTVLAATPNRVIALKVEKV
jgi:putative hemolysin